MLNIFYGNMPDAVFDTSMYFKNTYKPGWITDKLSVEMIKDVDKSDVTDGSSIMSPFLGSITPLQLSGGVKTLILINKDRTGQIFNASKCGDNCAKWILKMAEERKVEINLRHLMDFGREEFKIRIMNNNKIVHNSKELLYYAGNLVREGYDQ